MKLMADKWRPSRAILARSRTLQSHLAEIPRQGMMELEVQSSPRVTPRSAASLNLLLFELDAGRRSLLRQSLSNTKRQVTSPSGTGATAAWLDVAVQIATQLTLLGERMRYLRLRWTTGTS